MYTLKLCVNSVLRFFKFGYIPGRNFISLHALIERGLTPTLGDNVHIGAYAKLSHRGHGTIEIGDNSAIDSFVVLETRRGGSIKIGKNSGVNAFSVIYGTGGVTIGDYTRIAAHTVIVASNHIFDDSTKNIHEQGVSKKGIVIGNDVWIGHDALILSGTEIGDGAVIAARSVVRGKIEPYSIYAGSPAKFIRYRFTSAEINSLRKIKWWDWDDSRIAEQLRFLTSENLELFIKNNPVDHNAIHSTL